MSPESKRALATLGVYALLYGILIDMTGSYLTHLDDGEHGLSFLNLDVTHPKPETYNTLALIVAGISEVALYRVATRK